MDGNSIRMGGSKRQRSSRVLSRGFRCATVKTSSLIQRCKTIFRDASALKTNFKNSQDGNLSVIPEIYQCVMQVESREAKKKQPLGTAYNFFQIRFSVMLVFRIGCFSFGLDRLVSQDRSFVFLSDWIGWFLRIGSFVFLSDWIGLVS
jgi:hypothetical protein